MDEARTRVRERIVKELNCAQRRVASLKNDVRPRKDPTTSEKRETVTQRLDKLKIRCVELQGALRRIDKGTYGMCEGCDEFINPQRMLAFPETSLCADCQTNLERNRAARSAPQQAIPKQPPERPRPGATLG